jgi:hypothetical protein
MFKSPVSRRCHCKRQLHGRVFHDEICDQSGPFNFSKS